MPTMPAWLTHYHTVASCLDATPCPPAPDEPEMSEAVFQALVEGRLDEVEDQIEELPEWGQRKRPAAPLAGDPLRAIALAGLCRALPDSEAIAALTAVGAVTVLHCPPGGMIDDAASLLAAVLARGTGSPPVQIVTLRLAADARAKDRASEALDHAMAAITATTAPHVLLIEEGVALSGEIAAMLPAPLRLGPVDGWLIAAALALRGGGVARLRARLPNDAALRALSPGQLRFALRHRIRDRQIDELHRLVRSNRSNSPTLDDIRGYGTAEEAARRLVADLAAWSAGRIAWSDMTRSILFCGPPGTGKTWLARAIAASAGVPLIEGSFSAWQAAGHLGHMLGEMRASFAAAQAAAPAILFLDEIDSAGDRNSVDRHAENYRRQVINSLLELLDGATRTPGVVVVAACNDVDALDPALLRPGRIDRIVEVPPPGHAAIVHILARHHDGQLSGKAIDTLARRAIGHSAAAIDGALREACSRARAAGRALTAADVAKAMGLAREEPAIIRRVAVHEAGHAIAATLLARGRVHEIRAGMAGGQIMLVDQAPLLTRRDLGDHLTYLLAGRAAEELVLGSGSSGAGSGADSDLAKATEIALRLELVYGLSGHCLVRIPDPARMLMSDPGVRTQADRRLRAALRRARQLLAVEHLWLRDLTERLCAERVIVFGDDGLDRPGPDPEAGHEP
ncbi:AAA family ATPase [Paracoccus sediminis]|uniref:AAA family ATPase n=1 Tax=Paracoccus sediminis TaxID=1214787 RepID=A0A238YAC5_9RHOB|nr:AAA family ATPase [Paracoccus sediminis]TBN46999.1 AAA family ATPase [Paracoccus sediminis]SNR67544.1 Peptidase family M41 [Paracoccus sediminis]